MMVCQWCGHYHMGIVYCPIVKSFEYYPDGKIKRVEFKDEHAIKITPARYFGEP